MAEDQDIPEDVRDAIKVKNAFDGFLKTEAWEYLAAWIEDQVKSRYDAVVLHPLDNLLEVTKQEYIKGELAFGRTVLAFPKAILGTAQETINDYNTKKEEDDGKEESEGEGVEFLDGDTGGGTAYSNDGDSDGGS